MTHPLNVKQVMLTTSYSIYRPKLLKIILAVLIMTRAVTVKLNIANIANTITFIRVDL